MLAIVPLAGDAVNSGNGALVSKSIKLFRCPSDSGDPFLGTDRFYGIKAGSPLRGAKTNYDFSALANYDCDFWSRQPTNTRRMFGDRSTCNFQDVTDGTSSTVMVVESLFDVFNGECSAWGYRGWVMVGNDLGGGRINDWTYPSPSLTNPRKGQLGSWSWPGSLHPNGVQVCYADGAVRFVPQNTDTVVLLRIACIADGLTVTPP